MVLHILILFSYMTYWTYDDKTDDTDTLTVCLTLCLSPMTSHRLHDTLHEITILIWAHESDILIIKYQFYSRPYSLSIV